MVKKEGITKTKDTRPPIVAVMGHVDHGKTSILDAIRKTNVQEKEHGGITQHIGAYQISHNSQLITFIDTPGHEAFSQMRARGGKAADIVVLVVAADDGVMNQTREAISHAKAADATIIVAINKTDLPSADVEKTKQQLASDDVLVEKWGGQTLAVEVSAKTGAGLDDLLTSILAVSELLELKGNSKGELEGIIIESKLDSKRGSVVSVIVKNGTLRVGDKISASGLQAKIRSLSDHLGKNIKEAIPGMPVEILGFKTLPLVGDLIVESGSELEQLTIDEERVEIIGQDTKRTVSIILRADTQGTLEAVKASLANLVSSAVTSTYSLKFLHASTGEITESDVLLASNTKGAVVGFNVRIPPIVLEIAESKKVPIKSYKTIYELVEEVSDMLSGVALSDEKKIKGRAQVLKIFKLPSGDLIAGTRVLAGALKPKNRVAVYDKDPDDLTKEDTPLYTGVIKKLKKGKEDVALIGKDVECGVLLKPQFEDIAPEMFIEVF